jgi:hypothetical protein
MRIIVKGAVKHNGRTLIVGEMVDMGDVEGSRLVALGVASILTEQKTEQKIETSAEPVSLGQVGTPSVDDSFSSEVVSSLKRKSKRR